MSESTVPPSAPAPALQSTADTTPYVPVSWLAVAAFVAAVVFTATLVVLGLFAFKERKPLIEPAILALPVIAVVLSFAARRVIRNSEGTRTDMLGGVNLVNSAWWLSVVLGLCYIAYLFAIDFSIRSEASGEVEKWISEAKGSGEDDVPRAFKRILPPGARQDVNPKDRADIEKRFRDEFLMFNNCDLVQLAQRNGNEFQFRTEGVTWQNRPGGIEGTVTATATCPEGTFPMSVSVRGVDGVTGSENMGRQWMIVRPQSGGFLDPTKLTRTPYGWLLRELEVRGLAFGAEYIKNLRGPTAQYLYRAYIAPGGDRPGWHEVATDKDGVFAILFAMPTAAASVNTPGGDAGYADYVKNHFFRLPKGDTPKTELTGKFVDGWYRYGIVPPGTKLRDPNGNVSDRDPVLTLTEGAVEVRLPIEIPLPPVTKDAKSETARGRLLVQCTDPAVLELVKQLKASANPAQGTATPPSDLRIPVQPKWRVVRIESNLDPVIIAPPQRPGGPGGPSGPGGGMPGMGGPG